MGADGNGGGDRSVARRGFFGRSRAFRLLHARPRRLRACREDVHARHGHRRLDGPQAHRRRDRAVAIYRIVIGFGTNSAVLAKKKLGAPRCWSDLVKPEYKAEIELANPVTSGTGYTILATLITLYGEDGAFEYLKRLRPNVVRYTQSGTAQGPSVARGEV